MSDKTTTPDSVNDDDDGSRKWTDGEGGSLISAELMVVIMVGATFVIATIYITICCACCWNKKKPKPKTRQQQQLAYQPGQTQQVTNIVQQPGQTQQVTNIVQQHGQTQQVTTNFIQQPGPVRPAMQHPRQMRPAHPQQAYQPLGPGPRPQQGMSTLPRHPGPHPGQGPPPPGYYTAMRMPRPSAAPQHQQQHQQQQLQQQTLTGVAYPNLEQRHSTVDNKYFKIEVPAPQNYDTTAKSDKDVQMDSKLQQMALIVSKTIARTLQSISISAERISKKDVLGSGQFGVVFKGELTSHDKSTSAEVALKTIAGDTTDEKDMSDFMEEVLRMKSFTHVNVMPMLGMTIMDDKPYMVLPFMANGDLKSFISNPEKSFTVEDLLKMGIQVADGMHYLSNQNIIHGDLAARNCMVDQHNHVKVADFGLSRHLFQSNYYDLSESDALRPIRWMAPECIEMQKYTSKSDVWAFGILCWEIMTRGQRPYPDMKANEEVKSALKKGYRMPCPDYTAEEIYEIMNRCWDSDPANRPSFSDLREMMTLLTDQTESDYVTAS